MNYTHHYKGIKELKDFENSSFNPIHKIPRVEMAEEFILVLIDYQSLCTYKGELLSVITDPFRSEELWDILCFNLTLEFKISEVQATKMIKEAKELLKQNNYFGQTIAFAKITN
jgi:hypothetical protein